ncbi:DUF6470 family protein [Salsuginibacillus kocurii]|uniref:DUF6470 family protein n=1 Tax=Salsuginibacillus kocurii TaxID=427078 RepID=UPI001F0AFECB|nr:DUF6470 family protein [Salsuginibacillus kocurii]
MPHIQISTTDAKLGVQTERPPMEIQQHDAEIYTINNHVDTVTISHTPMELNVDQTEAFHAANLVAPLRSAQEFYAQADVTASEYTSKTVRQGDQMMDIANGQSAIPHIARENWAPPQKEANIGYMPASLDQTVIDFQSGDLHVDIESAMPDFNVERGGADVHIPNWQLNPYIEQKASIQFDVVGGQVDHTL